MIVIEHTGDGTTVDGTTREDAATIKQVGGFKWSRNLGGWYLPRTWHEVTRRRKAEQLAEAFGADRARLDIGELAPSTTAEERAAAHIDRARELAEQHANAAARLEAESDQHVERSRSYTEGIPFGQPILVGHHSQRGHEKALERSRSAATKAVETLREAELRADRAKSSAAEAEGYDKPARVDRRIVAARKELDQWQRRLDGSLSRNSPDTEWQERARANIARLTDQIARDERVLAESGVTAYSKQTVHAGDAVMIRGRWHIVDKANPTTIRVTSFGLQLPYRYAEIQQHKQVDDAELRRILSAMHPRDLRDQLRSRGITGRTRAMIEDILAGLEPTP